MNLNSKPNTSMKRLIIFILFFGCILQGRQAASQSSAVDYMTMGMKLFEAQDFMEAIISFNKAIEQDRSNFKAYYMRGNIKKLFEDHHGAMKDFNMAIELNPKDFEAYYERGNVKFALQDYYGAIADYTRTIELNENFVEAYYKRGQAKHQLEAYGDAINDCSKIIEINPKNVDAYFLRGILRLEHGQIEGGCLDLSKAGELGDLKAYEVIKEKCNSKCFQY